MTEAMDKPIGWSDVKAFFSPVGQRQIADLIAKVKTERGAGWIDALRDEKPQFYRVCELVATKTADEAYAEFVKEYPLAWIFKDQLLIMHAWLRTELEKPRFENAE